MMQLIPETARRFGVKNVFNPVENIQGGAKYLRYLLDLFEGSYPLALAAYNAGEGAVTKFGGIPPFKETQNYVTRILRILNRS
jgi:soluble lytic murein transglycosylase-like protein